MKFYEEKSLLFTGIIFLISLGTIYGLGSNGKAVTMKAINKGNQIEVELSTNKGFGIQKKGPHEITVYSLDKNHGKEHDVAKAISEYGKKIHEIKPLRFTGINASQDEEYFSSVNNLQIPVAVNSDIAIKAKIYYCSFVDSFCSVDVLYTIIPKK